MMATTLREALTDWSWLRNMDGLEIIATTCLGDVILRDASRSEFILDPVAGELRPFNEKEHDQLSGQDVFIARMESHGLKLGPGLCYGLKPFSVFKEHTPENMYVATMAEYVGYMGSFHRQIKDLSDGTTVRLEVLDHKVSQ
jgi:hypothetical protein